MIDETQALEGFGSGVICSMLVFGELAPELGLDEKTARRIASCFGSGMEHAGVCGCVTGAYMALGLKYGVGGPGEAERAAKLKEKKDEFDRRFIKKYGSVNCKELLGGLDPAVQSELNAAAGAGLFKSVCAPAVCYACAAARELLSE